MQTELTTKNEFIALLQQKNNLLDQEAVERKQLAMQNDKLGAELGLAKEREVKLEQLGDELAARLHSHYAEVPVEAVEAWVEPAMRGRREAEAVAER